MTSSRKKTKISVYLDPEVMQMLADFSARRDRSQSMVAEAAIASFLSPDDAERREAVLVRRLDQIDRRITRLERDVGISVESLAVFIRFWLTTTPALPEPAAKAARAKAGERYEAFISALGRRLAQGPKLRQEVSEDVDGGQVAEKISLASAADVGTVAVIIISGVIDPMQTFVSCQWRATVLSAAVVRRMSQKLVPLQGRRPQYLTRHRQAG